MCLETTPVLIFFRTQAKDKVIRLQAIMTSDNSQTQLHAVKTLEKLNENITESAKKPSSLL